jgi:tRNA pseudouridine32 synthase/23S rRNA pseudouridine746 synthase
LPLIAVTSPKSAAFNSFQGLADGIPLPGKFTFPFNYTPHPLSILASQLLQAHLRTQAEWKHNFGLGEDNIAVIGKMFGVLVVIAADGELGYLSAFSGKLAGSNYHGGFVPPIFDGLKDGGFLNAGMEQLSLMSAEISQLLQSDDVLDNKKVAELKLRRKNHSVLLQNKIFDQYHFLNQAGVEKSLRNIFSDASCKSPPAGAGECAAPKLLQYAFRQQMKPIALAEFWWGASPKSTHWKHQEFYPSCKEKCVPILTHMLEGIELDEV